MSAAPPREFSGNLDLLRSVAVMLVFVSHLIHSSTNDRSFGSLGRFGVIIFFVHTSFVLMSSLERLQKHATSDMSLSLGFWIRRFFRIYPLSVLFVILMAVFSIPASPEQAYAWIGLKGFVANLALAQNLVFSPDILGVLWSLPLEVQMYVMLPFAYIAIRGGRRYRSLALWVVSVVLALTLPHVSSRLTVFTYAPCFTSGVVAYDLIRSKRWTWKLPSWVWPVGILAVIALFGPHDDVSLPHKMYRAWGLSLLLGVLYANVEERRQGWTHVVFHWIAEHSYGIYLSHSIVLWIVFYRMAQFPLWEKMLVLIVGAIGIPALLYPAIERPLIQVGGRVVERMQGRVRAKKELLPVTVPGE